MIGLHRHLLRHRRLAAWIVAAALLMRLLVPTGFMPVFSVTGVTIEICTGSVPQKMAMAMPGMPGHGEHGAEPAKDMPCGFAGLALASLAAADPIVLALAIAFIVATVFRTPVARVARADGRLRPPLRGPPASA